MTTHSAEAKLYTGIRSWCVDKNISAAITSSVTFYCLPFRIKRTIADIEATASIGLTNERYKTYGGGNNVITPGPVVDNTNNSKIISSLVCKFPTYFRIDVEKLQLPEGTDCVVHLEEGWILEGDFPGSTKQPSPEVKDFFSFRTPWYSGLLRFNTTSSLTNIPGNKKQFGGTFASQASILARPVFNPGKLAAIELSTFTLSPSANYKVSASAWLASVFGPTNVGGGPVLATGLNIKQLQSTQSSQFNFTLPEFDVVTEASASFASEFVEYVLSDNSRIRYLIGQSLTNDVQLVSNTIDSRTRNTSSTITATATLSATLSSTTTEILSIQEPTGQANSSFGTAVAIDGNNIIVSDPSLPATNSGRVFIFNATTGALVRTINNPNSYGTTTNDEFGNAVDISGNYAIVGAFYEDGPSSLYKGASYLFNVSTGALIETKTELNDSNDYYFGYSVATDGTQYAVGQNVGGVKVYPITAGWSRTITTPDSSDRYDVVDISGSTLVVGVRRVTANFTDTFKVYQYSLNNETGQTTLVRTISNPNPYSTEYGDYFASTLSLYGNYLLVGAKGEDLGPTQGDLGKVYLFDLTTGNLVYTFTNPSPQTDPFGDYYTSEFGKSVALNNRYAIISDKNQIHIFNIQDGSLERTIPVEGAQKVSISGTKFIVSAWPNGPQLVKVFSF